MNPTTAMPILTSRAPHARRGPLPRRLLVTLGTLALLAAPRTGAAAEPTPAAGWEFVVASGSVVPAGAQRQSLDRGGLTQAQLMRVVRPAFAVTASAGWARSRDLASAARPKLDILTADLGAELRGPRGNAGRGVTLRPFCALGAGVRRYDSRAAGVEVTERATVFAGAGGEAGIRRARVRLEVRDYLTGERPAGGGAAAARHELAILAGVRWVAR